MPRITRLSPSMHKRGRMQRRHPSRFGSRRTPRHHNVPRKVTKRHKKACLDDNVEASLSNTFTGDSSTSEPNCDYLEGTDSTSEIPREISESFKGAYCGSVAASDRDFNIMDCNYISPNEPSRLEIPFVPVYRCQQCGKEVSDIINKEHLLELERLFWCGNQSIWDLCLALTECALIVDLGDPDYQQSPDSTLGYSSQGSSPETIFNYGTTVRCVFCEYQPCPFYRSLGVVDHLSYLTPDSSPRSDVSFLQEQHTTKTTMDVDELLPDMNIECKDLLFSLEAQTQAWARQHDKKFTNEFQPDIPDDPTSMYNCSWVMSQNPDDTFISPEEDHSVVAGVETEMSPSTQSQYQQSAMNFQPNSDQSASKKGLFACPWYKKDPMRYQECSKYKLNRIKDVKQHTLRKHMKPDIYCPMCFELFTAASERDGHIQKKSCKSQPRPDFDGISEDQRKELNQIANRGKSDMDQWYYMWDTIFPGTCRPKSPYLGNKWEKLVPLLRNFWNKRQPEILSKALQTSLPGTELRNIQCVVDKIFDLFEEESSGWGTNPDVFPEPMPSKIKEEDVTRPGTSNSMVPQDSTQQQWDIAFELRDPPLEQQMVLESDSNLEHMIGNHINVNLDIEFHDQDLVTTID